MKLELLSILLLSIVLTPAFADFLWYDEDWLYFKQITIDHIPVNEELVNFPFLVNIIDTDLTANANSDCSDIVFTLTNNTQLSHEIERCDLTANDTLIAWVKIPSISHTIDTKINMYYGNPAAIDSQDTFNVFDDDYVLVSHLNDTSAYDSTNGQNNMTSITGATSTDSFIGGGFSFDGINDNIIFANETHFDFINETKFTGTIWFKSNSTGTTQTPLGKSISTGGAGENWHSYLHFTSNDWYLKMIDGSGSTLQMPVATPLPKHVDDLWYYGVIRYDGGSHESNFEPCVFTNDLNGTACVKSTSVTSVGEIRNDYPFAIGGTSGFGADFLGLLDEVRISEVYRSDEWLYYEWCNMAGNSICPSHEVGVQQTNQAYNAIMLSLAPPTSDRMGGVYTNQLMNTVYKTEDETRTGDITYRIDPDLHFTMEANSVYYVEFVLFFQADTPVDMIIDMHPPDGATGYRSHDYYRYIARTTTGLDTGVNVVSSGAVQFLRHFATVYTDEEGEYEFWWRQWSVGAGDSTVLKGSFFAYQRLGCNVC